MAVSKPRILYAIGSQSHVNLVDPRSKNTLTTIISKYRGGGKFIANLFKTLLEQKRADKSRFATR